MLTTERRKQKQVIICLSCRKRLGPNPETIVNMLCFSRVWPESSFYNASADYIPHVTKILIWFSKGAVTCSIALMNKYSTCTP